jgi:hypothetical protein
LEKDMKRIIISIVAVALLAVMFGNVYAVPLPTLPTPSSCCQRCPGMSPGFWKHNIGVALGTANGAFSAFEGGPLDGVKVTPTMLNNFLADIKTATGISTLTLGQLLDMLSMHGNNAVIRDNAANWLNWVAGYTWYV